MAFRLSLLLFATVLPCISILPISALEESEKDWLEYYYESPTPENFVKNMKDWAEDGTLDNEHAKPALIAFGSQLIRQNRDSLVGWYDQLAGMSPEHKQVLHTQMLFSRTGEADKIMRDMFGKQYDEQKKETPKILELPLDKRSTLDMLWGFFYATGSENAIRRVVTCFRFQDAPDNPDGVDVPEGYVPLYKELPFFASNTLIANGERHPKVVEILEALLKDDTLLPMEKNGVYEVLSELNPKKYPKQVDLEKA